MAFKMKYTKGNFPHKQNTSPNKFLGAMMKAGAGLLGKRKSGGGGGSHDPKRALDDARAAMENSSRGMGGVFGILGRGKGPNLPGKELKGGGKTPGGFPGFGLFGGGPRGAAAMLKKNKDK